MKNFDEFYTFYLTEHQNKTNIALHYTGTTISFSLIIYFIVKAQYLLIIPSFLLGYAFAWVGHFIFEKNKPAAFKYPVKSFLSDLRLWLTLTRKIFKRNN